MKTEYVSKINGLTDGRVPYVLTIQKLSVKFAHVQ